MKDDKVGSRHVDQHLLGYIHLIDSISFDPKHGPEADAAYAITKLAEEKHYTLNVCSTRLEDVNFPDIPEWVRQKAHQFEVDYVLMLGKSQTPERAEFKEPGTAETCAAGGNELDRERFLTAREIDVLRHIEAILGAIDGQDRVKQTARNIFESNKYQGCFITTDEAVLEYRDAIERCCGATILLPGEFMSRASLALEERGKSIYNLPIFRDRYCVASPDGKHSAEMPRTNEAGMGNPMVGDLLLSDGLVLDTCSPCFVWSDDSRYLAVPQMAGSPGLFGLLFAVRMLVIDTKDQLIYRSRRFKAWLVPTRFFAGRLKVCVNPWGPATEVNWDIPSELATFTPHTYPQLSKPNPVSPSTRGSRPKPGAIFKPDWLSPVWPFMPFVLALLICIGILLGQIYISADPQETRIQTGDDSMAIRGLLIVLPLFWLLLLPIQSRFPKKLQVNLSGPLWGVALLWAGVAMLPAVAAMDVGAFADKDFSTEKRYRVSILEKREVAPLGKKRSYYIQVALNERPLSFGVESSHYQNLKVGDRIGVHVVQGRSGRQYITAFPGTATFGLWPDEWSSLFNRSSSGK